MAGVLDLFRLDGRRALVTGASKGLGAAMARALAEAGADVALVARGDLSATAAAVEATGRRAARVQADLGRPGEADRAVSAAEAALGPLDILVNNAGIIRRADFLDSTDEDWDAVMDVNLKAVFQLSRAFGRSVTARSGRGKIINVASLLSYQGGIRVAAYTASKSALIGLTRLMANELAGRGINVNGIAPGYMETDNTAALRADPVRQKAILERIPAGRWGTPDDLSGATVFLASPASDYLHGFTIAVDGGWLAR